MTADLASDIAHREHMEAGSLTLFMALDHARNGKNPRTSRRLLWARNTGSEPTGSASQEDARSRLAKIVREIDFAESLRTARDACTYCGVRGDVGCSHRRVA